MRKTYLSLSLFFLQSESLVNAAELQADGGQIEGS
jgi:hypothetical protein